MIEIAGEASLIIYCNDFIVMKILSISSELFPLVKTGGLGDVAGALPKALAELGEDIRVMVPGYRQVFDAMEPPSNWIPLGNPLGAGEARLGLGRLPGANLPVWVVECPDLYDRPGGVYLNPEGRNWPDNYLRFAMLARAAAMVCDAGALMGWRPDIVHAHDWQAGLVPAYLSLRGGRRPASVFTIHNIGFAGLFPADALSAVGLPKECYSQDGIEFFHQLSYLKAGIQYSDHITTVSPTYAKEILAEEGGMGFSGVLATKQTSLSGILNGIDTQVWNPADDPLIARPYDAVRITGKQANKAALQKEAGLEVGRDVPLMGIISRFTTQKGLDLMLQALPKILAQGVQMVVLGSGDPEQERALAAAAKTHPGRIHLQIGYDEGLAHRIQAGCDMLLMPSRFEPCGLTQLYALRYGALPIVRRTGGLADTVVDVADQKGSTGFVFEKATAAQLVGAVTRAVALYRQPKKWRIVQRRAMKRDFSWQLSARRYRDLFLTLL